MPGGDDAAGSTDASVRLPMFPLGTVLVPHEVLPLHVFEPRYRAMVHDCLASDRTFGVVLIERGSEVGGGDVRFDVACTARLVVADEQPDGRWSVVATGADPIRVDEWLPDDPYPRAEVSPIDQPPWDDAASAALAGAIGAFRRVIGLAEALGNTVDPAVLDLPGDPLWDHWVLVSRAPLGPLDKHALLGAASPAERMELLRAHLVDLGAVLASRLGGG